MVAVGPSISDRFNRAVRSLLVLHSGGALLVLHFLGDLVQTDLLRHSLSAGSVLGSGRVVEDRIDLLERESCPSAHRRQVP